MIDATDNAKVWGGGAPTRENQQKNFIFSYISHKFMLFSSFNGNILQIILNFTTSCLNKLGFLFF